MGAYDNSKNIWAKATSFLLNDGGFGSFSTLTPALAKQFKITYTGRKSGNTMIKMNASSVPCSSWPIHIIGGPTPSPTSPPTPRGNSKWTTGKIVGVSIGGVFVFGAILLCLRCTLRKRFEEKEKLLEHSDDEDSH